LEVLTAEGHVVRPRKLGVLRQDQFAFDDYRVIDTVIMGNKPLWAALEERDRIYAKPEMTDEDGMRLGELEGTIGDEDGYTAESDAAVLLTASTFPTRTCTSARWANCRAGKRCACCWRRRCSASRRRCCSTSRPTISISTRSTGCRIS
jgi:ATPase subunit of ABC transporter with duplicated ATPase domains